MLHVHVRDPQTGRRFAAGTSTTVTLDGKQIALFNIDGQIYATNDACPHAGASLGWGKLEGKVVKCRAQGCAST